MLNRFFQNPLTRHHDSKVDHLEVVTAEYDRHDILTDVVDVALHRGDEKRAAIAARH